MQTQTNTYANTLATVHAILWAANMPLPQPTPAQASVAIRQATAVARKRGYNMQAITRWYATLSTAQLTALCLGNAGKNFCYNGMPFGACVYLEILFGKLGAHITPTMQAQQQAGAQAQWAALQAYKATQPSTRTHP